MMPSRLCDARQSSRSASSATTRRRQPCERLSKKTRSYYAVAEALRSLAKIDRAGSRDELLAALDAKSHHDVILKAAADGLADIEDAEAVRRLLGYLAGPTTPDRRIAVLQSLVRLGKEDPQVFDAVCAEMKDCRWAVRRAAYEALAKSDSPQALDELVAQRGKESDPRLVLVIDETVEQLREKQTVVSKLRSQVESLRKEAKTLQEQMKKLEAKLKKIPE